MKKISLLKKQLKYGVIVSIIIITIVIGLYTQNQITYKNSSIIHTEEKEETNCDT